MEDVTVLKSQTSKRQTANHIVTRTLMSCITALDKKHSRTQEKHSKSETRYKHHNQISLTKEDIDAGTEIDRNNKH